MKNEICFYMPNNSYDTTNWMFISFLKCQMIISPITSIEKDDVNDLKEHTKRAQGKLWYRIFTTSFMSILHISN